MKFKVAAVLVTSNKITVEEQDTGKLGNICSERKACGQKWLTALCQSDRRM